MKKYKTALGRTVDMTELFAKNERTRAVGNMKVNARGDTIDSTGKIVEPVTAKVSNRNAKTVGNKSAHAVRHPTQQKRVGREQPTQVQKKAIPARPQNAVPQQAPQAPQKEQQLTEYEKELEQDMEDDLEIEQIKANEVKNNG